jgi:hypothetical protein
MPRTYEPIASQVLSSTATNVTFSSIPTTYTDLVVVVTGTVSSSTTDLFMQVGNGSLDTTTNYSRTYMLGSGSGTDSNRSTSVTSILGGNLTTTVGSYCIYQIMSYANTNVFKTVLMSSSMQGNWVARVVGLWRSTQAINTVSFFNNSSIAFASGSTFALYGIKAA